MTRPQLDFAIVANGFADGPAQALRDYLVGRGSAVLVVSHPLTPEEGREHLVEEYADLRLVSRASFRGPLRPPYSFSLDPFVPLRVPRVETWLGFNPLACARGLLARRVGRARSVVLWSVDFVPDRFGPGTMMTRLYDRLDKLCCTRADARVELTDVALTARNRRHGLADGVHPPAHVVPMGAWLDRVPTVGPEGHAARRVVLLAHLVRRQGADLLVEAASLLRTRGVEIAVDIIGTGPLQTSLQQRAGARDLDELVTFHGYVADHGEVERILASASIAVAPYRPGEGTFTAYADPGKIKAYLAAGLPILMTDVPPSADELARDAGAEIVPFDAVAMADAIARLLERPQEWRERRAAALTYVRSFDWPVLFDKALGKLKLSVPAG